MLTNNLFKIYFTVTLYLYPVCGFLCPYLLIKYFCLKTKNCLLLRFYMFQCPILLVIHCCCPVTINCSSASNGLAEASDVAAMSTATLDRCSQRLAHSTPHSVIRWVPPLPTQHFYQQCHHEYQVHVVCSDQRTVVSASKKGTF